MNPFTALVGGWHLLSLDAPCVAAVWTAFLARCFGVALPWTAPAALGVAVWMLYALDRMADASRPGEVLEERHRFHGAHQFAFTGAVIGAVPALVLLIALLPHALRTGWLLLALPMAGYVAAVHGLRLRRVPKEHLVAVFFAVATAMPVLVSHGVLLPLVAAAMAVFGALCWLNCVAIARWERARDLDAATAWAADHFHAVATAVVGLAALLMPVQPDLAAACILSAGLLLVLERLRLQAMLLRALADAALLTPMLWLAFVHAR